MYLKLINFASGARRKIWTIFSTGPAILEGKSNTFTTRIAISVLLVVISIGVLIRFHDLAWHFTHVDDLGVAQTIIHSRTLGTNEFQAILSSENGGVSNAFKKSFLRFLDEKNALEPLLRMSEPFKPFIAVPFRWTYAPFQFLLTPFFISEYQSYREILFWGRFPSFLFGSLGLVALLVLYARFFQGRTLTDAILPLTLLAFSWENIIYAQQMESYAIGVFAVLCLLILLFHLLSKPFLSFKTLLLSSCALFLLSSMQYQILFFVPAFVATLLMKRLQERTFFHLRHFFAAGGVYGGLLFPLYLFFLKGREGAGVGYSAGSYGEFAFSFSNYHAIVDALWGSISFFISHTPLVFRSMIAFAPETTIISIALGWIFFVFFLLGIGNLFLQKEKRYTLFTFFLLFSALTWAALILSHKLTLSPSRHSLILLPLFVIVVGEGGRFLFSRFRHAVLYTVCLSFIVAAAFFLNYQDVRAQRRDLFDEKDLSRVLDAHNVDAVLIADDANLLFMPSVLHKRTVVYRQSIWMLKGARVLPNTLAIVLHEPPPPINEFFAAYATLLGYNGGKLKAENYDRIYTQEQLLQRGVDFPTNIPNGSNGLNIHIYRLSEGLFKGSSL